MGEWLIVSCTVEWVGAGATGLEGGSMAWISATGEPACQADLDADRDTDVLDFSIFAASFGLSGLGPYAFADLDGNGTVDVLDFALFAAGFGCAP